MIHSLQKKVSHWKMEAICTEMQWRALAQSVTGDSQCQSRRALHKQISVWRKSCSRSGWLRTWSASKGSRRNSGFKCVDDSHSITTHTHLGSSCYLGTIIYDYYCPKRTKPSKASPCSKSKQSNRICCHVNVKNNQQRPHRAAKNGIWCW